jgi:hypothetical protein
MFAKGILQEEEKKIMIREKKEKKDARINTHSQNTNKKPQRAVLTIDTILRHADTSILISYLD